MTPCLHDKVDPTVALPALRTSRLTVASVALTTGLCVLITLCARWGPDWPAQEFRAWIAGHDGLSVWTTRWYSGSALPGYSVLYPPAAALIGPGTVGVLSAISLVWVATRLYAPRSGRARRALFGVAVAVSVSQNLLIGQVPFLLGCAFGIAALSCATRGSGGLKVGVLAALCALSSPLAGLFLLMLAPAIAMSTGWRRASPLFAAALGPGVAAVVGGASGPFPCPWLTALGVAVFCAVGWLLLPRANRAMQVFLITYLVVDVLAFAIPNPVGGNVARLAKIIVMPITCYFLTTTDPIRRLRAVLVGALAVIWPSVAFASSLVNGAVDPSRAPSFYSGLDALLAKRPWTSGRLEIPFTREHWESYFVAQQFPIARGWERQSDLQYNAVLYRPLTAARYRTWLDDNAVSMVALPHAPLDAGGTAEGRLLRNPPSYLVPVWHDANWTVWRVRRPTPLATGAATLVDEDPSSLTLRFAAPGSAVVRIRASNLWTTTEPTACVGATRSGWLKVTSRRRAIVEVSAQLNASLFVRVQRCGQA